MRVVEVAYRRLVSFGDFSNAAVELRTTVDEVRTSRRSSPPSHASTGTS